MQRSCVETSQSTLQVWKYHVHRRSWISSRPSAHNCACISWQAIVTLFWCVHPSMCAPGDAHCHTRVFPLLCADIHVCIRWCTLICMCVPFDGYPLMWALTHTNKCAFLLMCTDMSTLLYAWMRIPTNEHSYTFLLKGIDMRTFCVRTTIILQITEEWSVMHV